MNKNNILGFDICVTTKQELLDQLFTDFEKQEDSNFVVNINPEIIVNNYKNKYYIENFNSQKYQIADGIGIVYASRIKGLDINQRITGIDLMLDICKESVNHDARIFLYGAKENIADLAKKELEKEFNKINIVGTCDGYVDEKIALEKIKSSNANIIFVGLGSPKQENFILNNKDNIKDAKIFLPVGGSFDVISKNLKRAPNWMIRLNVEWLYRLIKEPKRILRQLKLIKFLFLVAFKKKE